MVNETYVLTIDIGGTFTDFILLNRRSGQQSIAKVLTSYPDPSESVLEGIRSVLGTVDAKAVQHMIHGTTLVTNTLIERKGARTGLITTDGFRDALEIGREGRYDIYDLQLKLPDPLVERRLRMGVPERINVRGEVLLALDEDAVLEACKTFLKERVEAIGICFLHSYANPKHEQRVKEIVQETMPRVSISVSHEVAPEFREYDRTSTTVANAYVQPLAGRYMTRLAEGLQKHGLITPLHIMLSNGGVCSVETAVAFPICLVESGPCGGALAAAYWAERSNQQHIMAFDMGGTTAKAILSSDGIFPITTESEVARVYRFKRGSGLPLLVPVMDLIEIGAGGGSIASLNEMRLPTVGPKSAGSVPGPACYGKGGSEATVTDADLIMGLLNSAYFLGGKMALDAQKAWDAVQNLAQRLDIEVYRMAWGIHRMVNENMANATRVHAAERGIDIRGYTMLATGGAGPVHACGVAELLGMKMVIVPPAAGVGSAFGLMLAPISFDFSRTYVTRLEAVDFDRLNSLFKEMESDGVSMAQRSGVAVHDLVLTRTADMRYVGQGHEIRVAVPEEKLHPERLLAIRSAFDEEYTRIYGRICEGLEIESVHWRVQMSGPKPQLDQVVVESFKPGDAKKEFRDVLFDTETGPIQTPVFDRYRLSTGFHVVGPAIVEEAESTTVVLPNWSLSVEKCGNLFLKHLEAL